MCFDFVFRVLVRESFIRILAADLGVAFTAEGFPTFTERAPPQLGG